MTTETEIEIPESRELNIEITCDSIHELIPAVWSHVVVVPELSMKQHVEKTYKGMLKLNLKNRL